MEQLTCPHREACGACAILGMAYAEQLSRKQQALRRAIREYGSLRDTELLATLPSPRIGGYRNRAKMAVGISRTADATLGLLPRGYPRDRRCAGLPRAGPGTARDDSAPARSSC